MSSSGSESYLVELLSAVAAVAIAVGAYITKILGSKTVPTANTASIKSQVHEAEVMGAVEVTKAATELVKALEVRVNILYKRVAHLETVNIQLRSEHGILTKLYEELEDEYKELLKENGELKNRIDLLSKNRTCDKCRIEGK